MKKIILAFIMCLVLASFASALGVSPASVKIAFEPNKLVEQELFIVNSENASYDIFLSLDGELAEYGKLNKDSLLLKPGFNSFNLTISLPEELEPGARVLFIKATPLLKSDDGGVSAFISMSLPVYVNVPYPDKYARPAIVVVPGVEGGPTTVYVEFDNLGSEDITSASARIFIQAEDGSISIFNTSSIQVPKATLGKVFGVAFLRNGMYSATAEVLYDSISAVVYANFTVGRPKVTVLERQTVFAYGIINRFSFKVRNDWNEILSVSGYVTSEGMRTDLNTFSINPGQTLNINSFLDATNLQEGDHEVTLVLNYGEFSTEEKYTAEFISKSDFDKRNFMKYLPFIIIILIIIILIAILLFIYFRNRKKDVQVESANENDIHPHENTGISVNSTNDEPVINQVPKSDVKDENSNL